MAAITLIVQPQLGEQVVNGDSFGCRHSTTKTRAIDDGSSSHSNTTCTLNRCNSFTIQVGHYGINAHV
ncbi:predicted protein [Lichtheimia corymbifera JMRC:FSU:9682]|uniref:Uncharacterized protein n=1 Tax=Lichtheimia corymbifera JMRC:FSU:9682 TaxID=1263082 RepID=A0A068RQU0_9FUNG|nr:predicted protein [Lichtheimia corymbifera JMRC:FSU:9682]